MAKRPSGGGRTEQDLALFLIFGNSADLRQIGTTGNVRFMAETWRSTTSAASKHARGSESGSIHAQGGIAKMMHPWTLDPDQTRQ
jgi:hypothetical protein